MANMKIAPPNLKSIQPYLKIAEEHEKRDPSITYWCRLYAMQNGLKFNDKSPENSAFFLGLMDWLEQEKRTKHENEAISNDIVAQAHIENYALKLFLWADNEDRSGHFNKNVVKSFYTSGFIYDLVNTFGEPSEEVVHHRKYAKWKATYIHNCLKNGVTPVAGPLAMEGDENGEFEPQDSGTYDAPSNNQPDLSQPPYPVGGLFNIPNFQPEGFNLPIPGAHAPPSTPNSSSQLSPTTSVTNVYPQATEKTEGGIGLRPEDFHRATKYCKWAGSALQYEDVPTAIDNLQKALKLLTTGQDG